MPSDYTMDCDTPVKSPRPHNMRSLYEVFFVPRNGGEIECENVVATSEVEAAIMAWDLLGAPNGVGNYNTVIRYVTALRDDS